MDTGDPWGKYPVMMTVEQVAEVLHVQPKTLYVWRKAGGGPPYTRLGEQPGSAVRYPREGLREYLTHRTIGTKA
jgi:predicted site-specific integrase-resolvase